MASDQAELAALRELADACPDQSAKYELAPSLARCSTRKLLSTHP
ncbi:hypothetical protein [Streptomyces purpurascens]|uniref:Uncharacterized protein n=1 Tax=Streptomyces purpurascens TaxID=1924 RepID=A0ABZ1MY55_STREF